MVFQICCTGLVREGAELVLSIMISINESIEFDPFLYFTDLYFRMMISFSNENI